MASLLRRLSLAVYFAMKILDARHEHTFYQFEGVYVGKGVNAGNLTRDIQNIPW